MDQENLIPIPKGVFVWVRGDIKKNQGLRLTVRMPENLKGKNRMPLTVSNIYDPEKSVHIKYGAQFADRITMSVSAVGIPGQKPSDPINCYDPKAVLEEKKPPMMRTAAVEPADSFDVGVEAAEPAGSIEYGAVAAEFEGFEEDKKLFPFPKVVGRKYY